MQFGGKLKVYYFLEKKCLFLLTMHAAEHLLQERTIFTANYIVNNVTSLNKLIINVWN